MTTIPTHRHRFRCTAQRPCGQPLAQRCRRQGSQRPGLLMAWACRQERSLLAAVEDLTAVLRSLSAALIDPPLRQPRPSRTCPLALTPEQEEAIATDALDLLDTPWEHLSVVELRKLLRTLPIDRTCLPAPIEVLRRHELIAALLHGPALRD